MLGKTWHPKVFLQCPENAHAGRSWETPFDLRKKVFFWVLRRVLLGPAKHLFELLPVVPFFPSFFFCNRWLLPGLSCVVVSVFSIMEGRLHDRKIEGKFCIRHQKRKNIGTQTSVLSPPPPSQFLSTVDLHHKREVRVCRLDFVPGADEFLEWSLEGLRS